MCCEVTICLNTGSFQSTELSPQVIEASLGVVSHEKLERVFYTVILHQMDSFIIFNCILTIWVSQISTVSTIKKKKRTCNSRDPLGKVLFYDYCTKSPKKF